MIQFQVEVDTRAARLALQRTAAIIKQPMRHLERDLQINLTRAAKLNYDRGRFGGNNRLWQPLKSGKPAKLVRSGKLKREALLQRRWRPRSGKEMVYELPQTVYYGRFHLTGTKHLPRRSWLPSRSQVTKIVDQLLEAELSKIWPT